MADERGKPVSSPARLAANHRNAQKSTGPRTAAGKRRAALNSQRLGLAPPEFERQLQERGENPQDFRRLHRDLVALFPPHEASDETAVRVLAETWWEKARRLRDWAGEGKPVTRDLDAKIDPLLLFLVNKRMERHEKWHVRLTAVLGWGLGGPADARRRIERRLFAFGATKFTRRYPKRQKVETAKDQFQAAMVDILARVSDPDKVAKAVVKFQGSICDILDQLAAEVAAGMGPKPDLSPGA
ncbi:MAG: hypothetical protein ACLQOO_04580 [Terriglobia bacterium]